MGSTSSNQVSYNDFIEQFEEMRVEYSQQLGDVSIYRRKSDHRVMVMLKEKWFNQRQAYEEFMSALRKRKRLPTNFNAGLITTLVDETTNWCSETFHCVLVYEYHERTLEQLMRHRKIYKRNQIIFLDKDFWSICRDLLLGLKNYKELKTNHGDV